MIEMNKLHWLAGILEGEATFGSYRVRSTHGTKKYLSTKIQLAMSDKDIVEKVASIFNRNVYIKKSTGAKTMYVTGVHGQKAVEWMMTLYSLMGKRRQSRIAECIKNWAENTGGI